MHSVLHKKNSSKAYRMFVFDLWEDICGWLDGTVSSWTLDFSLGALMKQSDTNMKKCPLENDVYVKAANASIETLLLDFLFPVGIFRLDATISQTHGGEPLAKGKIYFSVSERNRD